MPYSHNNWANGINIDQLPVGLRNHIYSGDGSRDKPINSESFPLLSPFLQFIKNLVESSDSEGVYGVFGGILYEYQKNNQIIKFSNKGDMVIFPIFPCSEKNRTQKDYFNYLEDASNYILKGEGTLDNPYITATSLDKFLITLQSLAQHSIRKAIYGLDRDELFKITKDGTIFPLLNEKEENILISKIKHFENTIYEKIIQLYLVLSQLCPLEDIGVPKNGKSFCEIFFSPKKSFGIYYVRSDLSNIINNITREEAEFEKTHPDNIRERKKLLSSKKINKEKLGVELYEDCLINDIDQGLQKVKNLIDRYPDIGSEYVDIKWMKGTKTVALKELLDEAKHILKI